MTNREQVFQQVFYEVLNDHFPDFKEKCARWGLDTYDLIEQEGKIVVSGRDEYPVEFTYALTFAVIVGEFGQFGYGDHFLMKMALPDTDISVESGTTPLSAFHEVIWERKEDIHRALNDIYTSRQLDPASEVFASLAAISETKDEDGITISSFSGNGFSREMAAYLYVSNGFLY